MAPNANRRVKSYFESSDFKIGSKHRDLTPDKLKFNYMTEGSPNVSPKNLKQKFFAGDKEAVMYQDPKEPKVSSYLAHHKGLKIGTGQQATILNDERTSFIGQIIPDPNMM